MTTGPVAPPLRWQEAVIERIEPRTPRVKSVFLRASLEQQFAGQHVDVRLTAPDGYQAQRSYSIASAPDDDRIELAVERLENGEVSTFIHDVALPGDVIEMRGPIGGHFIWRREDAGPLLLIAGGSGVAPLMAMLRHRAATATETRALLVYSARKWEELIFRDELLAAEARDPLLRFVATTTREPRHRPRDFDRRLDRGLLGDIITGWGESPRHVYVCGATDFVESIGNALVDDGIPASHIRTERYGGVG